MGRRLGGKYEPMIRYSLHPSERATERAKERRGEERGERREERGESGWVKQRALGSGERRETGQIKMSDMEVDPRIINLDLPSTLQPSYVHSRCL